MPGFHVNAHLIPTHPKIHHQTAWKEFLQFVWAILASDTQSLTKQFFICCHPCLLNWHRRCYCCLYQLANLFVNQIDSSVWNEIHPICKPNQFDNLPLATVFKPAVWRLRTIKTNGHFNCLRLTCHIIFLDFNFQRINPSGFTQTICKYCCNLRHL